MTKDVCVPGTNLEVEPKPDTIFRYNEAKLIIVNFAGKASTITFEISRKGRLEEHWCFYDEEMFGAELYKALIGDWTLSLVVGRCFIESENKDEGHNEDRLMQLWRIVKSD